MKRAKAVHYRAPGFAGFACAPRSSTTERLTTTERSRVTCRICVYHLLRLGELQPSDPRVTPAMLKHLRESAAR